MHRGLRISAQNDQSDGLWSQDGKGRDVTKGWCSIIGGPGGLSKIDARRGGSDQRQTGRCLNVRCRGWCTSHHNKVKDGATGVAVWTEWRRIYHCVEGQEPCPLGQNAKPRKSRPNPYDNRNPLEPPLKDSLRLFFVFCFFLFTLNQWHM